MIIGLTGGIASGKSTVSSMLKAHGAYIIDADKIAREIVEPGSPVLSRIVECFGKDMLNAEGKLNRKALGNIVFNNPDKLKLLNKITHPEIWRLIKEKIDFISKNADKSIVVVDAAVLLEAGMDVLVDEVWLVCVNEDKQIKRLMDRDHLTAGEAEARIRSQMPVDEKKKYSDRIIDNNGDLEYTKEQVEKLWRHIKNTGGEPVAPKA